MTVIHFWTEKLFCPWCFSRPISVLSACHSPSLLLPLNVSLRGTQTQALQLCHSLSAKWSFSWQEAILPPSKKSSSKLVKYYLAMWVRDEKTQWNTAGCTSWRRKLSFICPINNSPAALPLSLSLHRTPSFLALFALRSQHLVLWRTICLISKPLPKHQVV